LGGSIMKVLIAGASGLVGTELVAALRSCGHGARRLVRDKARASGGDSWWDPTAGWIDAAAVADCDAVVNLSGETIAQRWTARKKQQLLDSRTSATRTIAEALAAAADRPRTLINASAVGYYGDRGDERLNETSVAGHGDFLSDVCQAWEEATTPAARAGARVVLARFGVVLSRKGGALRKMLLPFRLGLGGKIGTGRQWMSWVAVDDVVDAILFALETTSLMGPVNVVAPQPVTNLEFTKTLGHVLRRPTLFPMPALAARAAFGQMADELLLASQRVEPTKLVTAGYQFKFSELEPALRHVLSAP
jgi:uncharacterized protein